MSIALVLTTGSEVGIDIGIDSDVVIDISSYIVMDIDGARSMGIVSVIVVH